MATFPKINGHRAAEAAEHEKPSSSLGQATAAPKGLSPSVTLPHLLCAKAVGRPSGGEPSFSELEAKTDAEILRLTASIRECREQIRSAREDLEELENDVAVLPRRIDIKVALQSGLLALPTDAKKSPAERDALASEIYELNAGIEAARKEFASIGARKVQKEAWIRRLEERNAALEVQKESAFVTLEALDKERSALWLRGPKYWK